MRKLTLAALALLLAAGCGSGDRKSGGGTDTDVDTDTAADTDSDSDTDTDSDTGDPICEELQFELEHAPVSLMILQDVSGSMFPGNWEEALPALTNVIDLWTDSQIRFGLDFFPDGSDATPPYWNCGFENPVEVDCLTGSEAAIAFELESFSAIDGLTPLACGMYNFTSPLYAPSCLADDVESFLLVVSDGADTCDPCGGYSGSADDLGDLSAALLELGVKTFVIGFGDGAPVAELNAIAANGGLDPPFDEYIPASDQASLEDALNDVASSVVNCIYDIVIQNGNPEEIDASQPIFVDNGTKTPVVSEIDDRMQGNGYFNGDPSGVDRYAPFNGVNDSWVVGAASRSYYADLLAAGVKIYEYVGGLLHTKSLTLDGEITLIGSANMDRRSFELNYENNILFYDPALTREMRKRQESYIAKSNPVTREAVDAWPVSRRLWNNSIATLGPVL